ncbi:Bug family tripartite tricarboxylate transporter substrate binding protein [Cupriavidus basilensis]|uniref:Bug family tripartite tricarboxylate transporter substrate binding protein n=1 Tax=Cupriavidus basilensis TaxID=68895 RepID=UPI0020A6992A|nr:tripartite tricarboxylate transporter substrate binding protein [Cupriavidus basilensis]MCP3025156.1 tripartite tricarboxylate transporter substrate binding protein [Cupriavidus basilensis]
MNRIVQFLLAAALALSVSLSIAAETFPTKPIRIISPFSAGGANDILARLSGTMLGNAYGQSAVVENRLGAGGAIGSGLVAHAAPDGYTLLLGSISTHSIGPTVYSKLPYNVKTDFTPISIVANVPLVLVVHPSVPAKNLTELLALMKSQPGKLNYASSGAGTIPHMTAELFKTMTKTNITHVPYKGDSLAMNDLMAGQVQMMFANMPSAINFVRQGQLRAIAVAGKTRSSALPDVPTIAEAGVPGFDVTGWYALFGPGGMPADVVAKLNKAIANGVRQPDMQEKIRAMGAEPVGDSTTEFASFLAKDQEKWKKTAATTGIKLD